MNSRMAKYELETPEIKKRIDRNKELYNSYEIENYNKFDINSNIEVLKNNANNIDVNQIKDMLDKKYRDNIPQRRTIDLPTYNEPAIEENQEDTKEYDLNSILSKVKENHSIDYDNLRINKASSSEELVNRINEKYSNKESTTDEEELKELINTITSLELKNQKQNADLLGLSNDDTKTLTNIIPKKSEDEFYTGKLAVTENDLDFKDIEDDIKSNSLFIKILIFIIILIFIAVGIYIVNNVFDLGLF